MRGGDRGAHVVYRLSFRQCADRSSRLTDKSTLLQERIGDPRTDRARWKRQNPLDNADKVGAPILLAYGISDVRVPIAHGNDFRAALDRHHKTYEWAAYGGEGHGLNSDEAVFDFYRHVERFLAKYLRGEPQAAAPATTSRD